MLKIINNYREVPTSVNPPLKKFILAFERLNPGASGISKYSNFSEEIETINPTKPLQLNEKLCEIAKNFINNHDGEGDIIKTNQELKQYLPKEFPTEKSCLVMTDIDTPEIAIIKLNVNDFDNNQKIKKILSSDEINQVGISIHHPEDDDLDTMMCLIFTKNPKESNEDDQQQEGNFNEGGFDLDDEDHQNYKDNAQDLGKLRGKRLDNQNNKTEKKQNQKDEEKEIPQQQQEFEDDDFKIEGVDLTELRLAFDSLDIDKNHKLRIKEICEEMDQTGVNESNPTLYRILKELNDGRDYVTWPEFANHFNEALGHKEKTKGRKDIYDVFKPTPDAETLDFYQLRNINEYLNLGYTDKELEIMLKYYTRDRHGISFSDYVDRVEKYRVAYELNEEQKKESRERKLRILLSKKDQKFKDFIKDRFTKFFYRGVFYQMQKKPEEDRKKREEEKKKKFKRIILDAEKKKKDFLKERFSKFFYRGVYYQMHKKPEPMPQEENQEEEGVSRKKKSKARDLRKKLRKEGNDEEGVITQEFQVEDEEVKVKPDSRKKIRNLRGMLRKKKNVDIDTLRKGFYKFRSNCLLTALRQATNVISNVKKGRKSALGEEIDSLAKNFISQQEDKWDYEDLKERVKDLLENIIYKKHRMELMILKNRLSQFKMTCQIAKIEELTGGAAGNQSVKKKKKKKKKKAKKDANEEPNEGEMMIVPKDKRKNEEEGGRVTTEGDDNEIDFENEIQKRLKLNKFLNKLHEKKIRPFFNRFKKLIKGDENEENEMMRATMKKQEEELKKLRRLISENPELRESLNED